MTHDYNNGQIHGWNGGACPVHPKDVVEVWFRGYDPDITLAESLPWGHSDEYDDIIAFKVVKPYVEPKVIWVNEYGSFGSVWPSEQEAREGASVNATRIAVKYVEAVNEKDAPHD